MSSNAGSVYVGVRGDIDPLRRSMAKAVDVATQGARRIGQTLDRNIKTGFDKSQAAATRFAGSIVSIRGAIAGLGSVYVLQSISRQFLESATAAEKLQISLDTITKGKGEETFQALNKWAAEMPVNTNKAIESFKNLRAMGLEPTLKDMTTLVDTASALGGSADTMDGIARAMGQMATKGKVSMEEMLQLAERGVPAFKILEEQMGLTKEQLGDIGRAGLDVDEVLKALMAGMADRFGGASEKMMESWSGMMESLKSTVVEFQRVVMNSGPFQAMKVSLKSFLDYLATNEGKMDLSTWATNTAKFVISTFKAMTAAAELFVKSVSSVRLSFGSAAKLYYQDKVMRTQRSLGRLDISRTKMSDGTVSGVIQSGVLEKHRKLNEELYSAQINLKAATMMVDDNSQAILDADAAYGKLQQTLSEMQSKTGGGKLFDGGGALGGAGIGFGGAGGSGSASTKIATSLERKYTSAIVERSKKMKDTWLIYDEGAKRAKDAYLKRKDLVRDENDTWKDFFTGFQIQMADSQENFNTWAEHGAQISRDLSYEMHAAFSDSFFNALKGDMDELENVWKNFMDSMLHTLTDTVAEMAIQWGISAIGGATGWWDSGAWEVKKDHIAVIHKGEMVVPADVASAIRGGSGSPAVSELATVSPQGGHEWSPEFAAFAKGTMGSYIPYAAQGLSLFAQDKIAFDHLMGGLLSPQAISTAAMTGGIPTAANQYLGMRTSKFGTLGQSALGALGGTLGGPFGAMIGGLLGGTAGMGLGDIFNARQNEAMRDYLEKSLGWFAGQKAYSGAASDVIAAHGNSSGQLVGGTLADPIGYNVDYGVGDNGPSDFGYAGDGETGVMADDDYVGFRKGGLVDRLIAPGEDGLASLKFGEGIISRRGMAALDKINSGQLGSDSNRPINIIIHIGNQQFEAYIGKIADEVRVEANIRGMETERTRY